MRVLSVRPPWRRRPAAHVVAVHDVRPLQDDRHGFEPFFIALCTCDALQDVRRLEPEAREDALVHAVRTGGRVEPEVRRPVG